MAILILSALITPPDVVSQLLVSFPIYGLYEFIIYLVHELLQYIDFLNSNFLVQCSFMFNMFMNIVHII